MILYDSEFLNDSEIKYMLNLWDDDISYFSRDVISFYAIDFKINTELDISIVHNNSFKREMVDKMRLQKYNETFTQISDFHGHVNLHNYILFLNDGFTGGELEFENGMTIKPKRGSLVYFNNNERHRVLPCIEDRYVFTVLGDYELNLTFNKREKSII